MLFYDGLTGLTDEQIDDCIKKAKALGVKVNDQRKLWNRIFHREKEQRLTGIWFNIKTQKPETK